MTRRTEPRLTLIELGLIVGSVAVLPFGGPMGFGFALGGSAFVAKAIRRARRPQRSPFDVEERLRELRGRKIPDAFLLQQVGGYVLIDALDHVSYRAVPAATLADGESVIATLCLHGTARDVEQQLLPWTRVAHPLFAGFAGSGEVNGTQLVLFHGMEGPCLEDVLPLPREQLRPLFDTLFQALEACAGHGVVLNGLPASRLKLTGPTLMFAWKEPFDGRRCQLEPTFDVTEMTPENLMGGEVGPRAMQFQLGMLLYQALTGRQPFADGRDVIAALMSMLQEEPAPLELGEPELEAFTLRLMAKDPDARFPSLTAAREAFLKLT